MVTGQFTIPMMKRTGFQPHFAGAVEATASTGGQIMPPVMGAAAFVMAEFMGIPYLTVCKHAIIPAVLYYLSVFMAVHFEALRTDLRGMIEAPPRLAAVLLSRGHLLLPVVVMLYILFEGYTPMYACIFSIIAALILANVKKETRMGLKKILKCSGRRGEGRFTSGLRLCLCRDHHRNREPNRAGPQIYGLCFVSGGGISGSRSFLHHDRRNYPGNGFTDHGGLYRDGCPARSGFGQVGYCADRRSHVRLLLCHHIGHHSAGRSGRVCRSGPGRIQYLENRIGRRSDRRSRVHYSFHVRL